jgi:Lactate racemase N-terminal domain
MMKLPRMIRVRQRFVATPPIDVATSVTGEFAKLRPKVRIGDRIVIGVGSRGVTNLLPIVKAVINQLLRIGANPVVIPAMGSHGGATPAGQREVLDSFGINEESIEVPICDSLDVIQIGTTEFGVPVYCSVEAMNSDGVILINRIKPHTDFFGDLGSGLLKMAVIGLGKRKGAGTMHLAATQFGYEKTIRAMANVLIEKAPLLGGLAIIENQFHETAKIQTIVRDEMATAENALLSEARELMPLLPFEEIDLLIVDQIGKNISGAGMDPNVINRSVHGYNSLPMRGDQPAPFIRRIFVRGLTPETNGNAIGIGMADATNSRLVQRLDENKTNINALTALTPQSAKLPIVFDDDRSAIEAMLTSLPLSNPQDAKIVRIADTLSVADMEVSESLWRLHRDQSNLIALNQLEELRFDSEQNLSDSSTLESN